MTSEHLAHPVLRAADEAMAEARRTRESAHAVRVTARLTRRDARRACLDAIHHRQATFRRRRAAYGPIYAMADPSWRTIGPADPRAAVILGVIDYACFMLDRHGHVLTWNTHAERINGYTAQEIVGQHMSVFYDPDDVRAGLPGQELDAAIATGCFEGDGWRVRKDGTRFWASATVTPLYADNGRLRGFAAVTRDDSERHQAVQERVRQLLEGQRHVAADLFDELIGGLFSAGLSVTAALGLSERPEVRDRMERAIDELDGLIAKIRKAAWIGWPSEAWEMYVQRDGQASRRPGATAADG